MATFIKCSDIDADSDFNCRGSFVLADVKELAQQIATSGLIQPVVVRPRANGRYQLIAGFRRFAAICKVLGWDEIEVVIRDVDDKTAEAINLIENIGRKNLNCLIEAQAMGRLYPEDRYSCRDVSGFLKKDTDWVLCRRYLLKLPPKIQQMFASGRIPIARAKTVLDAPNREAACKLLLKRKNPRGQMPGLKQRRKSDIVRMMNRLHDAGHTGLIQRVLAWINGSVTDDEINAEIDRLGDG